MSMDRAENELHNETYLSLRSTLPFISCVTLGRYDNLSELQFHHLQHEDNNRTLFTSICQKSIS